MNFTKMVLLSAMAFGSLASFGMEIIAPKVIATMSEPFFYSIYPGYSTAENNDKSLKLMALGKKEFYLVDAHNQIKKTCITDHQRILNAFYDKNGNYIITTASDQTVDIYDAECKRLYSINDNVDGIHLGIFGFKDGNLVVITSSKSNNNLSKVWAIPNVTEASRL